MEATESMSRYVPKFRREYVCLKCGQIQDAKAESCPKCGGPLCPRIVRVWG